MRRLRPTLALAVLGALSLPASAAILTVDCTFGPFFDIPPAIAAAAPGDTVVVHPCPAGPFSPFSISSLDRLHVVGAERTSGAAPLVGAASCGAKTSPGGFMPRVVVDGAGFGGSCVTIDNTVSASITGLHLTRCDLNGIEIVESVDTAIVANRIDFVRGVGVLDRAFDTQLACNLIAFAGTEGVALDGAEATLVADNLIGANGAAGVALVAGRNLHVVNNDIRINAAECIVDSGVEARIERNSCADNGGAAEILVTAAAVDADVVGNDCAGGLLLDFGAGTEAADNACP